MSEEEREQAIEEIRALLRARANEATGVPLRVPPTRLRRPEKNW